MFKRKLSLAAAALLVLGTSMFTGGHATFAQSDTRTFSETGKTVSGKFLDYWNTHGSTALLGLPISDQMQDVSPTDGKTYTMQYFERAVLELHPENAGSPFEVEGSLIGSFFYHERYLLGADAKASTTTPTTFPQTGMTVGGRFLQYWQQNGGLAQFGYPISNEFQEKNQLDGKTYTVQYFERAVFELHPENQAPNDVLLSQLGKFQFDAATSLTYTDFTGTKVTLAKRPQRVVCLFSLCEDILYTLGIDPAAVSDTFAARPDFWGPTKAATFGKITGGFAAPNLEDIAAAKPDLVIGFLPHVGLRDSLKNIAPLYIMNPALYQDSVNYELQMGYLLGRPYQARLAVEGFGHKMQSYKAKATNDQLPLILFGNNVNFAIMTSGSLFGSVLAAVTNYPWAPPGPNDVLSPDQEPGTIQYSLEKVLEKDPDVLLIETRGGGTPLSTQLAADPLWSQLKAVQNKRAYDVDFSLYVGGRGMRSLSLALDDAMTKIYPNIFPKPLN